MLFQNQAKLAKEKMLQTERALEDYFRRSIYNPEQEKQLLDAARVARGEFIDHLALLWPTE